MTMLKYLIPVVFVATLALPASAEEGVRVFFKYEPEELTTSDKRHALLERIKLTSKRYCATGSIWASAKSKELCKADLVDQFVVAIDDEELTVLAATSESKKYRAAQR